MTMINTMNPVPSDSTSDFKDNATVLDQLVNLAAPSVNSRLGVPLKTYWQLQQDIAAFIGSPNLSALALLVGAANKGFYFTGPGAMSTFDFAAQGRTFLAATTQVAQRTAIGASSLADDLAQTQSFGLGGATGVTLADVNVPAATALNRTTTGSTNKPLNTRGEVLTIMNGTLFAQYYVTETNRFLWRYSDTGAPGTWVEAAALGLSATFATLTLTGPTNNAPTQTVASAATVNLATTTADSISVTGTTTITSLGNMPAGTRRRLIFAGILTLTNNAAIIIPGGANITTAAGDIADVESTAASTWRVANYTKANGQPSVNIAVASGGTGGTTKLSAGVNLGVSAVGSNTTELAQSAMVQSEIANKRAWASYSPSLVASSGTYTSAAATGESMVAFGICYWRATITITTKGTGATPRIGLPFPAKAGMAGAPILARAINVNFKCGAAFIEAGLTTALVTAADTTDLGSGDGAIIHILGSYPVA